MKRNVRKFIGFLGIFTFVFCCTVTLLAADMSIRGVVTDNVGKPLRGAMVKATLGGNSVTRLTQKDGRFEIAVAPGTHTVVVDAYGFGVKRQTKNTAQAGDLNFTLTPKLDVAQFTSAELESLLPDNAETRFIKSQCVSCHSFATVMRRRGSSAQDWKSFLPTMTRGRMVNPRYTGERLDYLAKALEKYFGPDAPYLAPEADPPKPSEVKHTAFSDAALKATIREYTIPSPGAISHSIMVDANDEVWFSEYDYQSNAIGRFDPKTEKFQEYRIPVENSAPHTGVVAKDGRIWMSLSGPVDAQLAVVNPKNGEVKTYLLGANIRGSHSLEIDTAGNIWISGTPNGVFNVTTEKFRSYALPIPESFPDDSLGAWARIPGQSPSPGRADSYHMAPDSRGTVWFAQESAGRLVSVEAETGATKTYRVPGMVSVKGVAADDQGNIWFANFQGHKLGKLNSKSGDIKLYQPPTENASPYGVTVDSKTGYVWYADMNANQITRFDPKTDQFVEYPVPTHQSYPRFIGVDSKGRVWFTEFLQPKIGVLDTGEDRKQLRTSR